MLCLSWIGGSSGGCVGTIEGARDGGGTGGRGVWKRGGVVMACSGDGHGVGGGRGVWWHGGHGGGGIVVATGAPRHGVVMVMWWWL